MDCSYCGKSFASRQSLNRHVERRHKDEEEEEKKRHDDDDGDESMQSEDDREQEEEEEDSDGSDDSNSSSESEGEMPVAPLFKKQAKEEKEKRKEERRADRQAMLSWRQVLDETFGRNVKNTLFANKNDFAEELKLIRKRFTYHQKIVDDITSSATYELIDDEPTEKTVDKDKVEQDYMDYLKRMRAPAPYC